MNKLAAGKNCYQLTKTLLKQIKNKFKSQMENIFRLVQYLVLYYYSLIGRSNKQKNIVEHITINSIMTAIGRLLPQS